MFFGVFWCFFAFVRYGCYVIVPSCAQLCVVVPSCARVLDRVYAGLRDKKRTKKVEIRCALGTPLKYTSSVN
jgi:heme exporter protein D